MSVKAALSARRHVQFRKKFIGEKEQEMTDVKSFCALEESPGTLAVAAVRAPSYRAVKDRI